MKTINSKRLANFYDKISFPRTIIFMILCVASTVGLLSSYLMVHLEINSMALRYPLSFAFGYFTFLGLIRVWAEIESRKVDQEEVKKCSEQEPEGVDSPWPDLLEGIITCGEGFPALIVLGAITAFLIFLFSVISTGPILLGEVVFDIAIAGAAYKALANAEKRHWLGTAVKRTYIQGLFVLCICFFLGIVLDIKAPESNTLGQALKEFRTTSKP